MKETIEEAAREFDKSKCKHFRREHTKEEVYDSFEDMHDEEGYEDSNWFPIYTILDIYGLEHY